MGDKAGNVDGSVLCAACGLCCDGTLFEFVPLGGDDDVEALSALGISHGQGRLEQPCPAHDGLGCRVYAARPANCRSFHCMVLKAYRRGDIDLAEAMAAIDQALALRKALFEAFRGSVPEMSGPALSRLWRQWDASAKGAGGADFRRENGLVLMRMAALHWYFQRHFRPEESDDGQTA